MSQFWLHVDREPQGDSLISTHKLNCSFDLDKGLAPTGPKKQPPLGGCSPRSEIQILLEDVDLTYNASLK